MKVILYMGVTPNGFIAKPDGDSEWTSEEDIVSFFAQSKSAGNIILGKNTFDELRKHDQFPFPDVLNVVMSHQVIENQWGDKMVVVADGPHAALKVLEEKGFETAFIAGGGKVNASFFTANLIDEIYFDVEPLLFSKGISVIAQADFEYNLKLLGTKKLNDNTVQLHYQVIHS